MKHEISKILVKWNMPTRQVAISEIVKLFRDLLPQKRKHSFTCIKNQGQSAMCDCAAEGFNLAIDTILEKLNNEKD